MKKKMTVILFMFLTLSWTACDNAISLVNTYADTYNLSGNYASGWYMPSISQLCDVYENREMINTSLKEIYALDKNAAMDGLGTNWYRSSSQSEDNDDYVWFVHYFNGYSSDCPKNLTNLHVLVVRDFKEAACDF